MKPNRLDAIVGLGLSVVGLGLYLIHPAVLCIVGGALIAGVAIWLRMRRFPRTPRN